MSIVQKLFIIALFCAVVPTLTFSHQCCKNDEHDSEIITEPQIFYPAPGTSVHLPCDLEPDDETAQVTWSKGDFETLMVNKIKKFGDKYTSGTYEVNGTSLIVNNVNIELTGRYTCEIVLLKTSNVSHTVILTYARNKQDVRGEEEGPGCPIKTQPQTLRLTIGSTVRLPCKLQSACNECGAVVSWIKSNTETLISDGNKVFSDKYGINKFNLEKHSYDLIIRDAQPEDACQYTCQVNYPKIMRVTHAIVSISSTPN